MGDDTLLISKRAVACTGGDRECDCVGDGTVEARELLLVQEGTESVTVWEMIQWKQESCCLYRRGQRV